MVEADDMLGEGNLDPKIVENANDGLLEIILNATTGTLPTNSAASVPRWSGPVTSSRFDAFSVRRRLPLS